MSTYDASTIDALRQEGLSYSEIGRQLGSTKDAVRGVHRRWLQRSESPAGPAALPAPSGGDTAGDIPVNGALRGAGQAGPRNRSTPVKSEVEVARAAIAKATRTEVRLKHSLLADAEINELLAQRLRDFDLALQHGELRSYVLTVVDE